MSIYPANFFFFFLHLWPLISVYNSVEEMRDALDREEIEGKVLVTCKK